MAERKQVTWRGKEEVRLERLQAPRSEEAEQALLGAILRDSEALNRALEVLDDPSAFYVPRHRLIYEAMLALYEQSQPCDITTVANQLQKMATLEKVGGRVYLVELVEGVASTVNVVTYANIVLEKWLLRRLIRTADEIAESCRTEDEAVDALLDKAESSIFMISERRLRKGFVALSDLLPGTMEQIEELQSPDSTLVGLQTGFRDFDEMTNGLRGGELVIIAGRPSMGKSALAMNIAEFVAIEQKKAVGVFSLEMSAESLAMRLLCGRAKISQQRLRSGKLADREWPKLTYASGPLSEAPIYIDDSANLSSLEMRAKARRLKAQADVSLIIVDYIQMMTATGRFDNRQQEIATISRGLKSLAKELDVPVIACSQLSRMVEQRGGEKRPQLSDLRESGAIEQDADVVAFVYRPEHYLTHLDRNDPKYAEVEGKAQIIVAKQRNGPTGTVNLTFLKEFARFENLEWKRREVPPGVEPVGGDEETPF